MEEYVDISKLSVKRINKDVAKNIIIKHHYTHAASMCRYAFGLYKQSNHSFFDSHDELVGVATYGSPVGRLSAQSISDELNPKEVLELTRLFVFDDHGKNIESYFMAQTFRWFKENDKSIAVLMSYSDPAQGHLGGIYQATNWLYQGDEIRQVDSILFRFEEDGEWLHPRTVFSMYGTNDLKLLEERVKGEFWVKSLPRKHRYIYFLCSKGRKRKIIKTLKHPEKPYPKQSKDFSESIKHIIPDSNFNYKEADE